MGTESDPRKDALGSFDLELKHLYKAYSKEDPPPERVKPVPIQLAQHAALRLQNLATPLHAAVADLLITGFFFLLRPGEHTYTTTDHTPFRLRDVSFNTSTGTTLNAAAIPLTHLRGTFSSPIRSVITAVHLNFTTQKNGIKDEAITHSSTEDPLMCPLKAIARRVLHLRHHHAHPDTPLHTVFLTSALAQVTSHHITTALKLSCSAIGPSIGICHRDISVRALRAGGAMALLRSGISATDTRLFGRWRSWAMLHYLHRSQTTTTTFASKMLHGGQFTIAQHATLPEDVIDRLHHLALANIPAS